MQLRYRYRLDPTPAQRQALARAFGCARVVYNDALADIKPYSQEPQLLLAEKQLSGARSFPPPEGTDKVMQVVADATEAVITKRMTGEQAAGQLADQAKQLLGPDKVVEQ